MWLHSQYLLVQGHLFTGEVFIFNGPRLTGRVLLAGEHSLSYPQVLAARRWVLLGASTGSLTKGTSRIWAIQGDRFIPVYHAEKPQLEGMDALMDDVMARRLFMATSHLGDVLIYQMDERGPNIVDPASRYACRLLGVFDEERGQVVPATRPAVKAGDASP